MPRDILPPVEHVQGPRKCILTEKAREAAATPSKRIKAQAATVKAKSSTVSVPALSAKSSSSSVAAPVPAPVLVPKDIPTCPDDYTDEDYDWGTDHFSSPLPAPTSPTPYESEGKAIAIKVEVDSDEEVMKLSETAEAELCE